MKNLPLTLSLYNNNTCLSKVIWTECWLFASEQFEVRFKDQKYFSYLSYRIGFHKKLSVKKT